MNTGLKHKYGVANITKCPRNSLFYHIISNTQYCADLRC